MTVHAYLRVSTDEQSNEQQESEIKKRFPDILNENIAREKESALKYETFKFMRAKKGWVQVKDVYGDIGWVLYKDVWVD